MMSTALLRWTLSTAMVLALTSVAVAQQVPEQPKSTEHSLKGGGGVSLQVPVNVEHPWKKVKQDDVVLVLERPSVPDKGLKFGLLLVAVEQGPASVDVVDWKRVRQNVVDEAKKNGSDLRLEAAGAWKGAEGTAGRRFKGSMTANSREVAVSMVAIASPGALLTISEVAPAADGIKILDAVAKSARFGATP